MCRKVKFLYMHMAYCPCSCSLSLLLSPWQWLSPNTGGQGTLSTLTETLIQGAYLCNSCCDRAQSLRLFLLESQRNCLLSLSSFLFLF